MAAAFKCERCKHYFDEKNVDGKEYPYIVSEKNGEEVVLDLCPTCKEKLVSFINVKETTNA